jgi:tellurite resistance protein
MASGRASSSGQLDPFPPSRTMAIELGIPAVGGLAYFAVAGQTVSFVVCALGGYAVLMALVQVRLIPVYRRLSFTPGSWSFTFAYAAGRSRRSWPGTSIIAE